MVKMIRALTWKAQASNVLPSFPHHQLAQASGPCFLTCVSWLQPIGRWSWKQMHEVLLPASSDKLVIMQLWEVVQAAMVAPWRSYIAYAGI